MLIILRGVSDYLYYMRGQIGQHPRVIFGINACDCVQALASLSSLSMSYSTVTRCGHRSIISVLFSLPPTAESVSHRVAALGATCLTEVNVKTPATSPVVEANLS
jgi:hypothetical protein